MAWASISCSLANRSFFSWRNVSKPILSRLLLNSSFWSFRYSMNLSFTLISLSDWISLSYTIFSFSAFSTLIFSICSSFVDKAYLSSLSYLWSSSTCTPRAEFYFSFSNLSSSSAISVCDLTLKEVYSVEISVSCMVRSLSLSLNSFTTGVRLSYWFFFYSMLIDMSVLVVALLTCKYRCFDSSNG